MISAFSARLGAANALGSKMDAQPLDIGIKWQPVVYDSEK